MPVVEVRVASGVELASREHGFDLSVLIPAFGDEMNLALLLPWLRRALDELGLSYELIVVTRPDDRGPRSVATGHGAEALVHPGAFGEALVAGLQKARGEYVLTLDSDLPQCPPFVRHMWDARHTADITIASRYVRGANPTMPVLRLYLSRLLNIVFGRGLSVPVRDLSSGFRLYRRSALEPEGIKGTDYDVLEEILVRAFCEGRRVQEIPFDYAPRRDSNSPARLTGLVRAYLRSFWSLWKLRNSIESADYDDRAFDSPIPLQRYWQRSRFRITSELMAGEGPVLDVGCGSSQILASLPEGSVALDILARKLRYDRRFGVPLVLGSGFDLPFPDGSFSCVLSSQVIEHVPKTSPMIDELCRVLKPGGRLVLGTPDYSRWEWVYLEKLYARFAPGAYADEHVAHYTRNELIELLKDKGLVHEETRYIARAELIMAFRHVHAETAGSGQAEPDAAGRA